MTSTKTHVQVTADNIAPFIDFVVCPSYQAAYKIDAMEYYGLNRRSYVNGSLFYPIKQGEDIDLRYVFENITYRANELFSEIVVNTLSTDEPKIEIDVSERNLYEMVNIDTKYSATFGRCYSIQLSEKIIRHGIISVAFKTKRDVYVYFGHPGQFMHVNTKAKVFFSIMMI